MSGSLAVDLFFQEIADISWRMVKTEKIDLVMLKWHWSGTLGWQQNNSWCMGIWRCLFCYLECIEIMELIIGWSRSFWIAYLLDVCTSSSCGIGLQVGLGFLYYVFLLDAYTRMTWILVYWIQGVYIFYFKIYDVAHMW